jgi:hypothetical protein
MRGNANHRSKWIIMAMVCAFSQEFNDLFAEIKKNFLLAICKLGYIGMITMAHKAFGSGQS